MEVEDIGVFTDMKPQAESYKDQALKFIEKVSFIFFFMVVAVSVLLHFYGPSQAFWNLMWFYQTLNFLSWTPIKHVVILPTILKIFDVLNFRFATKLASPYLQDVFLADDTYKNSQYQGFVLEAITLLAVLLTAKLIKIVTNLSKRENLRAGGTAIESRVFELGIYSLTFFASLEFTYSGSGSASIINKLAAGLSLVYVVRRVLLNYKESQSLKKKLILGFSLAADEEVKMQASSRWNLCLEKVFLAGLIATFQSSVSSILAGWLVVEIAASLNALRTHHGGKLLAVQQYVHRMSIIAVVGVLYFYRLTRPKLGLEMILGVEIVLNSLFALFVMTYNGLRNPIHNLESKEIQNTTQ